MTKQYAQQLAFFAIGVGLAVWQVVKGFAPKDGQTAAEAASHQWALLGWGFVAVSAFAIIVLPLLTYRAKLRMSTLAELHPAAVLFLIAPTRELHPVISRLQQVAVPPQPAKKLLHGMQSVSFSDTGLSVWRGGFTPEIVLSVPGTDIVSVESSRVLQRVRYYPAVAVTVRRGFDLTVVEFVVLKSRGWYRRATPGDVAELVLAARRVLVLV